MSGTTALFVVVMALLFFAMIKHMPGIPVKEEFEKATVIWVADGDTIDIDRGIGTERVRVIGIDAPETHHPDKSLNCLEGTYATEFARELVRPGDTVWLERDSKEYDDYGRLLRHVWLADPEYHRFDRTSFSCIMARSGHAKVMHGRHQRRHKVEITAAAIQATA